jgi:hypothetical protein
VCVGDGIALEIAYPAALILFLTLVPTLCTFFLKQAPHELDPLHIHWLKGAYLALLSACDTSAGHHPGNSSGSRSVRSGTLAIPKEQLAGIQLESKSVVVVRPQSRTHIAREKCPAAALRTKCRRPIIGNGSPAATDL